MNGAFRGLTVLAEGGRIQPPCLYNVVEDPGESRDQPWAARCGVKPWPGR